VFVTSAGGGFLLMLQLWMAVTATANSEQLAVASLIAYDVYRWEQLVNTCL
jgi:Na+/proline symporter